MNTEQYWRQAFQKYRKGDTSQRETKTIDQFFLHLEQDHESVWEEVDEPAEEVKRRIQSKITLRKAPVEPRLPWYNTWIVKVAASVLLVLGMSFSMYIGFKRSNASDTVQDNPVASVVVAAGQQKEVTLPDGSLIKLNGNSELSYSASDFGSKKRKVHLKGEAFFQVKRDTARPFIVETQGLTTRVLGTSFNINTHDNEHAVTVATGLVEVSEKITGKAHNVLLHPSEKAVFNEAAGELQKQQQVSLDDFAWTDKILVLQNMPLQKAIARVERWYGVQIAYDTELAERTITARYENESLEHVMQSLSFLLDLSWEKSTNHNLKLKNQPKS